MQISEQAINRIEGDNVAIAGLMIAFNVGQKSIENWLKKRDIRLTTPNAVKAIMQYTDLTEEQILATEIAK